MADQDLNIKIVTTADAAGIKEIEAELARLKALAALGLPLAPPAPPKPPTPPGGDGEGAGLLDKAAAKIEHGIFRSAVHAIGIGVVYELVGALKEAGKEIEKTSDELAKQGEQLTKNAILYGEQAKFATTQGDVVRIGNAALKDLEETHKRVIELQQQELGYAAKFSDFINVQLFKNRGKIVGDYEAARQANLATAEQSEEIARQSAYYDVLASKTTEARHAGQTYEETLAELNARMKEQQALADTHFAQKDVQSYLSAAAAVEKYKKEIEGLNAAKKKTQDELSKRVPGLSTEQPIKEADAQTQRILMNEQAAAKAKAEGRDAEAEMFQHSADQYKASATPQQLADLQKIHELQDKLKPVEAPKYQPLSPEEFQRQNEAARKALEERGRPGLTGDEAKKAREADIEKTRSASQAAESERKKEISKTGEAGEKALAERLDKVIENTRLMLDAWR